MLGLALGAAGSEARAQSGGEDPPPAGEMAISFERVRRQLDRAVQAEDTGRVLRLNDYVAVYARLPALELIEPTFDLSEGPIPSGAPTRVEMLNAMAPREWRLRRVNLANVIGWALSR